MLAALDHLDVLAPRDVYWAGRLTLCADPEDLSRYDRCFAAYFSGRTARPARSRTPSVPVVRTVRVAPPVPDPPSGDEEDVSDNAQVVSASAAEVLRHRDVSALTPDERAEVNRLVALLGASTEARRSRRLAPSSSGRLDPARTIREALRRGGEPAVLRRRTHRTRPRRLVLLVDVSGSMSPYADTLLRFAHAAIRASNAHTRSSAHSPAQPLKRATVRPTEHPLISRSPEQEAAGTGTPSTTSGGPGTDGAPTLKGLARTPKRVRAAAGSAGRVVEVFSVGTRLTRLTPELRNPDPDAAMRAASAAIPDWSGGTRLGEELKEFLDRFGQRGLARGAVVVIASDGWERGDAALLGEQMARLSRLAHRVIWANPHKARPGYEPLTAGMAAALPHLSAFTSGHSLAALEELARLIGEPGHA
ncbi:vWA domain-containing protein [Actinomadura gamaensis]|uniref:VWA domain-containing protein n=1 Tax=Actinomadura gamaensis TaxID=1763541 RepID=A0ABV9TWL7_9ACTN